MHQAQGQAARQTVVDEEIYRVRSTLSKLDVEHLLNQGPIGSRRNLQLLQEVKKVCRASKSGCPD
jgi:hypothetical protein